MKDRKRNPGYWMGGLIISLLFITLFSSSSGSGMGLFKRYFPLILKDYPPAPTPVGPVGGTFTALVVDPNQNNTILAGSYVSGVYKTYDQGDTWYRQNTGLGNLKIQSLAYHPTNSNIVYAGTYEGGIYKSIDGGTSWYASNGGVLGTHVVYDIEIDPNQPNVVYAATRINVGPGNYNNLRGYLYKSTNAGSSWSLIISGDAFSTLDYFYDIDVNPLNSNELYLTAHSHGFYKSTNAGVNFFAINNGVSDLSARSFALDNAYPGLVYGAVWHDDAAYKTWNGGVSWTNARTGIPTNAAVFRMYPDPYGGTQKRVFACTYGNGLYSTDDFGQTWSSRGLSGQRLYDFVVANGSPKRWFAATESNGVFRTNAGSSSWSNIMGELRLNSVTAILQDDLGKAIYSAVYGKGVYTVDPTGTDWVEITQNLPDKAVIDLALFHERLLVLTESSLYSLDGEDWRRIELPWIEGSEQEEKLAFLSEKIGLPEEILVDHLEQAQVALGLQGSGQIPVLPIRLFIENDNLYMGTIGNGLYMRVANSWNSVGFNNKSITDIVSDNETGELVVVACETTDVCEIFQFKEDQLFALQSDFKNFKVNDLLETETGLLAATSSGVFRFDRQFQQWSLVGGQDKNVLSLTSDKNCAFAGGGEGFILLSSDCGNNWQERMLENWHYQAIGFIGQENDLLLLGTQEAGALILPIQ